MDETSQPELPGGLRGAQVMLYPGAAPDSWSNTYFVHDAPCGGNTIVVVLPDEAGAAKMPWDPRPTCESCGEALVVCECECPGCAEETNSCTCPPGPPRRHVMLHLTSLRAWTLPETAGELKTARPGPAVLTAERLGDSILRAWQKASTHGSEKADLTIAARVLGMLGVEVPRTRPKASGRPTKVKGKPLRENDLKAVRSGTRRAELCELLWSCGKPVPRSVHELTSSMNLSRSAVLSHLHCLARDHGVGYRLQGDAVELVAPDGYVMVKHGA